MKSETLFSPLHFLRCYHFTYWFWRVWFTCEVITFQYLLASCTRPFSTISFTLFCIFSVMEMKMPWLWTQFRKVYCKNDDICPLTFWKINSFQVVNNQNVSYSNRSTVTACTAWLPIILYNIHSHSNLSFSNWTYSSSLR